MKITSKDYISNKMAGMHKIVKYKYFFVISLLTKYNRKEIFLPANATSCLPNGG